MGCLSYLAFRFLWLQVVCAMVLSSQQSFFPESLSISETIYIPSAQGVMCHYHTVTSLCGKVLPSLLSKMMTFALGTPNSHACGYRSCSPLHPHCPKLHMALTCPTLPLSYMVTHSTKPLSSWGSCLGRLLALLKYILKKHFFTFFHILSRLGRRQQCSM